MVDSAKKQKKGFISEEDVSTILQRYTATTVLSLLQEVAQSSDVKMDWNALVKNTTTGISNAREYQMLWHHLAYRHFLLEKVEDGAQPLDDDSDFEYELEAFPPVNAEASMEAAACVKVMIASGSQNESNIPNSSTFEAPLTINIPNGKLLKIPSENSSSTSLLQGTNITVPVSVQKQRQPAASSVEGLNSNGAGSNFPSRRKRKPWSEEEDLELIAAVKKHGEGNWANILKADFKGNRTASQLSQRWGFIRKKQGTLNKGANSNGSQLSEAQLAARRAIDMALKDNLVTTSVGNGPASTSTAANLNASNEAPLQLQSQQVVNPTMYKPGMVASTPKPHTAPKKVPTKPAVSAESIQAAAVAAGARIASASDAATLLKAAQSKNAVHIMAVGSSLIKSAVGTSANTLPGHPNVHYVRTSKPATQSPNTSGTAGGQQARASTEKHAASPPVSSRLATSPIASSGPNNTATSSAAQDLEPEQGNSSAEDVKASGSNAKPIVRVQEDAKCASLLPVSAQDEVKPLLPSSEVTLNSKTAGVDNSQCALSKEMNSHEHKHEVCNETGGLEDK